MSPSEVRPFSPANLLRDREQSNFRKYMTQVKKIKMSSFEQIKRAMIARPRGIGRDPGPCFFFRGKKENYCRVSHD